MSSRVEYLHTGWTREEFLTAHKYRTRYRERHILYRISWIVAWVLLIVPVLGIMTGRLSGAAFIVMIWPVYWLLGRPVVNRWERGRQYERRVKNDAEVRFTFSDDGIESKGEDSEGRVKWAGVFKWQESPEGFLVFEQDGIFMWFPFAGFESQADLDTVRNMAKQHVATYEVIR